MLPLSKFRLEKKPPRRPGFCFIAIVCFHLLSVVVNGKRRA